MALSIDATSSVGFTAASTSATVSHTCAAGVSFLVAIVDISSGGFDDVQYNGVSMSFVATDGTGRTGIWLMSSPPSGAHNLVGFWTGVRSGAVIGVSTLGAGTQGATGGNTGTGTTATQTTATTGTAGGFVFAGCTFQVGTSLAYTGSGTSVYTVTPFSGVYEAFTASNNPTETWTDGVSVGWNTAYLELSNVPATSGFFNFM